jgi:NTE family protein
VLLSYILLSMNAGGQAGTNPVLAGRIKLGVVLDGGGALGLAHIGALQWFEEHCILISYVAGTGMGGAVGGIYATGKSPERIKEITDGINWDDVLTGQTPFKGLSFRRKEDAHEVPNSLEFGLRRGLQFPGGFNRSQSCLAIFRTESFNDLPIPFACVAPDLVFGKPHVFRSGPLAQALR